MGELTDPILTPEIGSTISNNSTGDPLEALIRDYTLGQQTKTEGEAEPYSPLPVNTGKQATDVFNFGANTAQEGTAKEAKKQKIMKEKEQQEKAYKLKQEFMNQADAILKDTGVEGGSRSFSQAATELTSLSIKAESAGLKDVSDVISTAATKGVMKLADMHEKKYQAMAKQQSKSYSETEAKSTIDLALKGLELEPNDPLMPSFDFKKGSFYFDKNYNRQPYLGKQDDGQILRIDDTKVENYIRAAQIAKVSKRNPALGRRMSDAQKEKYDIKQKFLDSVIKKDYKRMNPQQQKNYAADYILSLVGVGEPIDKAYSFIVPEIVPNWFESTFTGKVPGMEWSVEDLFKSKLTGLKEEEAKWIKLKAEEDKELGIKKTDAPVVKTEEKKVETKRTYPTFATEAEARKAGFKKGAVVRIGKDLFKLAN